MAAGQGNVFETLGFDFTAPTPPAAGSFRGPPANFTNDGGISLRLDKIQNMPACIPYSYKERLATTDGIQVEVGFYTPFTNRKAWCEFMLGYPTVLASLFVPQPGDLPPPPPILSRVIPFQHPERRYEQCYCVELRLNDVKGTICQNPFTEARDPQGNPLIPLDAAGKPIFGAKAPLANWPCWLDPNPNPPGSKNGIDGWADYTAIFRSVRYRIRTDEELAVLQAMPEYQNVPPEMQRYVRRTRVNSIQSQPLPKGTIYWVDGPNAGEPIPDNAAYVLVPTAKITWEWLQLPDPPSNVDGLAGTVNNAPFDGARGALGPNGIGTPWPTGTLLCEAPQYEESECNLTGRVLWRALYTALYRPNGWNKLIGPDGLYHSVALMKNSPAATLFLQQMKGLSAGAKINNLPFFSDASINAIQQALLKALAGIQNPPPPLAVQTAAAIAGLTVLIQALGIQDGVPNNTVNGVVNSMAKVVQQATPGGFGQLYQSSDFNQLFTVPKPGVY